MIGVSNVDSERKIEGSPQMGSRLVDKIALVTGAGAGIGSLADKVPTGQEPAIGAADLVYLNTGFIFPGPPGSHNLHDKFQLRSGLRSEI